MSMLIVDSDVIIDVSRGDTDTTRLLNSYVGEHELFVSAITRYEVLVGCRNKTEMRAILQLLAHFQTLALNEDISQLADSLIIEYALSHGMKPPDALIAATALHYESLLLLKNQKDFRYIVDFKLL